MRTPHLLLVEDSQPRVTWFRRHLRAGLRLLWTPDAGRAIGVLRRDRGDGCAGVLLDHDLTERPCTVQPTGSGTDVAEALARYLPRDVPILVHSSNVTQGPAVARRLSGAGFDVLRLTFMGLQRRPDLFVEWQDEVLEQWSDEE